MHDVTISPQFTLELEAQVAYDRTDERPSRADFEFYELHVIVSEFALHWSRALPVPGDPYYRYFFMTGLVVPAYSVTGHMMSDGRIELIGIAIDWEFDPEILSD